MFGPHLSEDTVVLYRSGDLPADQIEAVEYHLAECVNCRAQIEELGTLLAAVDAGSLNRELSQLQERMAQASRPSSILPLKLGLAPALGTMIAALAILVFLLSRPPELTAREFLIAATNHAPERQIKPEAIIVRFGQNTCPLSPVQNIKEETECGRLMATLQAVPWNWADPLSAKTYLNWHDSLRAKKDEIHINGGTAEVRTITSDGSLRQASLFLKTSDYTPSRAQLEIDGLEPLSIEEGIAPPSPGSEIVPPAVVSSTEPSLRLGESALDESSASHTTDDLEVKAWTMLHELNADNGYEAVIERDGESVTVAGYVASPARKQTLIDGLKFLDGINLRIATYNDSDPGDLSWMPKRQTGGSEPALARQLLGENLPPGASVSQESDQILTLSRALLGRAHIVAAIEERLAKIAACPCSESLRQILESEQRQTNSILKELVDKLEPLTGKIEFENIPVLTEAIAAQLDATLLELLSAASPNSTIDDQLQVLRKVLADLAFTKL